MIPLSTTEAKPLEFKLSEGKSSEKFKVSAAKIGWLHSLADQAGARFDIKVKDSMGRLKFEKVNCGNDTEKFGELVNIPTHLGEELEVEVSNVKGAETLKIFLN